MIPGTRRVATVVTLIVAVSTVAARQPGEVFLEQSPFALHSAFWPNLHQTLWAESGGLGPVLTGDLSSAERAACAASRTSRISTRQDCSIVPGRASKAPIETYWKPYLAGAISREQAIKNVVTAIR